MRSRLATALCAAALVGGLSACDSVQQATDAAVNATDKASICVEALRLANFTPNEQDVEQTASDARRRADELRSLADRAADTTLRDALTGMSDKVSELDVGNLSASSVLSWTSDKVAALNALAKACA
ncbi:bacteriophage spanin2 family protein [Actinokineospora sp. G85]|uniref:bacteriophage spanin2 family protein n=1 Tax=Actinokineospora sp. G85 TaxID=3406626 RepID=UPI003C729865